VIPVIAGEFAANSQFEFRIRLVTRDANEWLNRNIEREKDPMDEAPSHDERRSGFTFHGPKPPFSRMPPQGWADRLSF